LDDSGSTGIKTGKKYIDTANPISYCPGIDLFPGNQYIYFGAVLSGSMEPVFKKGDLVLMQTLDKEPHIGDIISSSVYGYNAPVTHRVIEINKYGLRTKGDNNQKQDDWVLSNDKIIGKAVLLVRNL